MKVAIDTSSITNKSKDAHTVRGIGSYTRELVASLKQYAPSIDVIEFSSAFEIPDDAELVHYPYFDPFFHSLPFRKKAKTVVTVHDFIPLLFPNHFPAGLKGFLKWQVQRFLLGKMDGIISVSESTTRDCLSLTRVHQSRIQTIYSAGSEIFSTKLSQSELMVIQKTYKLPEKFILYVGDATWNKNLPRLFKAVSRTRIPLVAVGKALSAPFDPTSKWNTDLLEIDAMAHGESVVQKLGYVSQKDLAGLYQLALMLVMPSLYEGFGFPILEAMMSRCPVVTSRSGAIPEIAGNAALLVDPESITSITEGINSLAENEKQRRLFIEKGLIQAKQFSWKKTAEQTANFYQEIHDR